MTRHRKPRAPRTLPAGNSGTPIVAIVGRPNVGKSTFFNRLTRARIAIVHDEPGVTRDRHYADTEAFGTPYTLVDTGGFDPESDDPMKAGIVSHVRAAVAEADVIVFVTEAGGVTGLDRSAIDLLRRSDKPVLYVANKCDSPAQEAQAHELYSLGAKVVFPVSALHGRGMSDFESALAEALPERPPPEEQDDSVMRVAIVGRPNAGKSSLLNRLLGEERMLVDDRPGTTRDAIDALVTREGRKYVVVDTAGIRRKSKVSKAKDTVESLSVLSAIRAIERAQVVVVLCDAKEGVAEQDAKIAGIAHDRARAIVIGLNKIDVLSKPERTKAETNAKDKLAFISYAPIVPLSAKSGRGVGELFAMLDRAHASFFSRVGTGELNRFFEEVLDTHPPPTQGGRAPRLYYVTQAQVAPPTFVAMTNAPDALHFSYRRFVENQLRKRFGFEGSPVRVLYRERRRTKRRA